MNRRMRKELEKSIKERRRRAILEFFHKPSDESKNKEKERDDIRKYE